MSTTVTSTFLFPAEFNPVDGSSPLIEGTWTATYNAAGVMTGLSNVNLYVIGSDNDITEFTTAYVDPTTNSGGVYQIFLPSGSGGTFQSLYLDWNGETPTTLDNNGSSIYTSVMDNSGGNYVTTALNPSFTGDITNSPCYSGGTRIMTPDGEMPVEDLAVGQMVSTASGGVRPIRWIGYRRIDLARHTDPDLVRPVRFAAAALADGVPARDLVVSPDHGMLVDGALIPARLLVNHRSITLDHRATAVTYYHVELDQHDIVLAEGAQGESYLDTGNRDTFENALVTAINPDMSVANRLRMPQDGACMALVTDTPSVLPVWQRLADRAGTSVAEAETDVAPAEDGGIRLMVGTRAVRPVVEQGDRVIFALPRDTSQVRLVAAAARPNKARPWLDDRRTLSVAVKEIAADHTAIPLDGPALGAGWWDVEGAGSASFRWSNGDGHIAVPRGTKLLTIRLHAAMPEVAGGSDQAQAA